MGTTAAVAVHSMPPARILARSLGSREALEQANQARQFDLVTGANRDPAGLAAEMGWTVEPAKLSANVDGLDAVLIPAGLAFRCLVDPDLAARERWQESGESVVARRRLAERTRQFRIAHEIGHSYFYEAGNPPRRLAPVTAEEERYCDTFALALLFSPTHLAGLPTAAGGIARFAERSNTTLALAAMATAHHGHLTAVVAGTLHGEHLRIEWHLGLPFDPSGWVLPLPTAPETTAVWGSVVDDIGRLTWWADGAKAVVAVA